MLANQFVEVDNPFLAVHVQHDKLVCAHSKIEVGDSAVPALDQLRVRSCVVFTLCHEAAVWVLAAFPPTRGPGSAAALPPNCTVRVGDLDKRKGREHGMTHCCKGQGVFISITHLDLAGPHVAVQPGSFLLEGYLNARVFWGRSVPAPPACSTGAGRRG